MRLTYEGLLVAKLWEFKKIYLEPAANSTSRLLQLGLLVPSRQFRSSRLWKIQHNTLSCTHPRGPSGHCLLGTLPCGFYLRSCSISFPSPETQPDCSVAGGEVGEAGRDGKVVSLEERRQDQLPQSGGSSVPREFDLPFGFWNTVKLWLWCLFTPGSSAIPKDKILAIRDPSSPPLPPSGHFWQTQNVSKYNGRLSYGNTRVKEFGALPLL